MPDTPADVPQCYLAAGVLLHLGDDQVVVAVEIQKSRCAESEQDAPKGRGGGDGRRSASTG